jgi:hypothetical protein
MNKTRGTSRALRGKRGHDAQGLVQKGTIMCLKGKSTAKAKPGNYICSKCEAVSEKKKELCDPAKIKDENKKKDKKKGKKNKKD